MNERTFRGRSAREALQRVKQAMGDDCLIVSQQRVPGGVEVVVATAEAPQSASHRPPPVRRLDRLIEAASLAAPRAPTGGVLRLVGPSGAGKTTSLLKLLFREVTLRSGAGVTVQADQQARLGAGSALSLACRLLDVPLRSQGGVPPPGGLTLIDTDGERVPGALPHAGTTLLVCPATMQADMYAFYAEKFAGTDPDGVVLTQFDQVRSPGVCLQACVDAGLPVWWLGTGTHLPADLVAADPATLSRLVSQRQSAPTLSQPAGVLSE